MSILLSVISVILAMVITAFMQLPSGIFMLFYHYALGNLTTKKADDLALSFIFGTETFITIIWLSIYFIISSIMSTLPAECPTEICIFILAGIIAATAIIFAVFYYRRGRRVPRSTTLFISRRTAHNLTEHAKTVTTREDAFLLGFFVNVPELIFTLPLYLASALLIVGFPSLARAGIIISYLIIAALPLFIIRFLCHAGLNLANLQRIRIKSKPFITLFIPACFILLTIIIINLGIIN
ncbi:hypothetical protein IJ135_01795 [Candidatus Saccharibacteria bacterium]|nr:hypothetical protein [Candidatus Saccharibacteria bacterium]